MSKHTEAQWNAAVSAALQADDVEAVPHLLVLMALDGYGHEAESLRRSMVNLARRERHERSNHEAPAASAAGHEEDAHG